MRGIVSIVGEIQPPPFSPVVFGTLTTILLGSFAVFFSLVRRWTTQRRWIFLHDWARRRRFKVRRGHSQALPEALRKLLACNARVEMLLEDRVACLLQIETDPAGGSPVPDRWNVLVRRTPGARPASALRPANAPASLVDRMDLMSYPSLKLGHRFSVAAATPSAARAIADSASRTLVPADIGLAVVDEWIVLDFSTRPFDPIEFDRMLALGQQLSQMV